PDQRPSSQVPAGGSAAVAKGGAGKASHAAALRAKALELGYNLDHEQALESFKESIAADPDDPAGAASTTSAATRGSSPRDSVRGEVVDRERPLERGDHGMEDDRNRVAEPSLVGPPLHANDVARRHRAS